MVFGDFYNDSQMLLQAKYSFVMENANEDMKPFGNFIAPSNDDDGVMRMIKNMCSMPAGKLKTARFKFPFDFRRGPGPCLRASFSAVLPGQHRLQQELQFDGYRLSLSYLFVVVVIGY